MATALLGKRKRQGDEVPKRAARPAPGFAVKSAVKPTAITTKSAYKPAVKNAPVKSSAGKNVAVRSGIKSVAGKGAPTAASKPEEDEEESDEDLRAIFQRAFEARFKPIEGKKVERALVAVEDEDDGEEDDDDEEEFGGLSGDEDEEEEEEEEDEDDEDEIEVVEVADIRRRANDGLDKKQMRAFMSAKPPSLDSSTPTTNTSSAKQNKTKDDQTEDDGTDAANLKNDLALQRLLNESHLLDSSFTSTDPSGKNRHKATDLRLLSLGSKGSILEQKNMPLSHRKGINAKKEMRETDRRREAKENGIILERAAMKKSSSNPLGPQSKRERGIGGPSVGRFSGGALRLTKQDVASITGPKRSSMGGKKGGGRGGKSGRR